MKIRQNAYFHNGSDPKEVQSSDEILVSGQFTYLLVLAVSSHLQMTWVLMFSGLGREEGTCVHNKVNVHRRYPMDRLIQFSKKVLGRYSGSFQYFVEWNFIHEDSSRLWMSNSYLLSHLLPYIHFFYPIANAQWFRPFTP